MANVAGIRDDCDFAASHEQVVRIAENNKGAYKVFAVDRRTPGTESENNERSVSSVRRYARKNQESIE